MDFKHALLLFLGSVVAGIVNAFAGGGAFITLPLLIFLGLPSTIANMTGCVSTWPGMAIASLNLRHSLGGSKRHLRSILLIGAFWSFVGSVLIMCSSDRFFGRLVPYLLLLATLAFVYGTWFLKRKPRDESQPLSPGVIIALSLIGLYGGYWGGGMGIMTISLLTVSGWTRVHEMNAVKILLMTVINGIGVVLFIGGGFVSWPHAAVVCAGASLGGYLSSRWVTFVSPKAFQSAVAVYAAGMTVLMFWRSG